MGDGLTPTELKGQRSITHGAVLDFLKQSDKWLKANEAALRRLQKGQTMKSGGAGPSQGTAASLKRECVPHTSGIRSLALLSWLASPTAEYHRGASGDDE
jgi:hypothetical protein